MRKFIAFMIAAVMLLGTTIPAFAATDTDTTAAQKLEKIGLMSSVKGDFKLTGKVTKGEAISLVIKMLGAASDISTAPAPGYSDVLKKHKYYYYIAYAKDLGLISGVKNSKFKPDSMITEKAFLEIVTKAMGYSVSDYATTGIFKFAYAKKIVTDVSYKTKTKENANFNRGNIASILNSSIMANFADDSSTPLMELLNNEKVTWEQIESAGYMYKDSIASAIASVTVDSATVIKLKLNEPITTYESAIITEKVNTSKVLTLVKAESTAADSLTYTTAAQAPGTEYTVTLKNVVDKQGHTVASISYTFKGFAAPTPVEVSSSYFKIKKVVAITKSQIDVYFTQNAGDKCENPAYYELSKDGVIYEAGSAATLSCSRGVAKGEVVSIWLKNKTFEDGKSYTLKISGEALSLYGAKLGGGKGDSVTFLGNGAENTALKIVDIIPVENNTLDIVFNKDLDLLSAQNASNYQLIDRAKDQYIRVLKTDIGLGGVGQKTARVRFAVDLTLNNSYELAVSDVRDRLKSSTISEERVVYVHKTAAYTPLKIDSVYSPDRGTLIVYFNRPLSNSITVAKYQINGGPNVSPNVIFDPATPNQVILYTTGPLMAGSSYLFTVVSGASDISGNMQTTPLAANFITNAANPGTVSMSGARMISENQVLLNLNVPISASTKANQFSLEYLDGKITKLKTCSSINFVAPATAVLTFDEIASGTNYMLKGFGIMDYTNQYTTPSLSGGIEAGY